MTNLTAVVSDHACRDSSKNADTIRRILNLPPTAG
jgi:hypothetical protein